MEITFADRKLQKNVNDDRKRVSVYGQLQADKLRERLVQLLVASTLEEVRHLPGKFHELGGNRKGQWACDLNQPYRLIFRPHEDPIPINSDGQYVWAEIRGVEILEIVNYHKER